METTMTEEETTNIDEMVDYMLTNWEIYKEMEKKMELYNDKIKEYMQKEDMDIIKTKKGKLQKITQVRNNLDRSLIKDIRKYYRKIEVVMLYKSMNKENSQEL